MSILNKHPDYYILFLIVMSFIVARIPIIGKYIRVVNTLFHETGHCIMTLITDGQVIKAELFSDTSGTTVTKSKSKLGQFLIAIAGYPFASLMGYIFAILLFNHSFKAILLIIAIVSFVNLLFFVRNTHGIFWIVTFITLVLVNLRFGNMFTNITLALIIGAITFFESFWSTIVIMYLSVKKSKNAGDATNLSKLTGVPAFIWAFLFFAISSFVVYKTWHMFLAYNVAGINKIIGL